MKHLTRNDRFIIYKLLKKGYKKKVIADIIGCHINTITNELKRTCKNTRITKDYNPNKANEIYRGHLKKKGKVSKLLKAPKLTKYIRVKICNHKYSPNACIMEIKSRKLKFEQEIKSVNTIYNAIQKGYIEGLFLEYLPRKREKRKRKIVNKQRRASAGKSIEKRDPSVLLRKDFGHWEMDTMIGKKSNSKTVLVLTERKTRFEIIEVLKRKSADEVVKALNRVEKRYGKCFYSVFKSITVDNGQEFSNCKGMEKSLYRKKKRTNIYYCHPYSSYERGSNENNNNLIRYWLPKHSNFDDVNICNIHIVKDVQLWINDYPRALFDGGTAKSLYIEEMKLLNMPYIY